jgi:hypothetical protein
MRWFQTLTILAAVVLLCPASHAAQRSGATAREAFYRCKDASGQTHYGDSLPQPCRGLDTEVLNENGITVRLIEGERSRTARQAREATETALRQERDARLQRDRTLVETYLSVEDIERLRDQRLDLLTGQYRVTEQNIANLRERQNRLEGQVARFRPYNDNPDAPPLPDHLAEEMVNTVKSLEVYRQSLDKNRQEQVSIKAEFDADIERFKELKNLR